MKTRNGFVLYRSFIAAAREMKRPDLEPRLIQAVVNYGLDRIEPDFGPGPDADILRALWVGIRPVLCAERQPERPEGQATPKIAHSSGA